MHANPSIFLDTSIQIERFMGLNQRRVAIEQTLASPDLDFVTSDYVMVWSLDADFGLLTEILTLKRYSA